MKHLSNQGIADILAEYSVTADGAAPLIDGIQSYVSLLLQWNQSISLTTITDPEEIVRFHFGESLFAASCVPIRHGRLADVGAGAGFPGLPLRMLIPSLNLTLIESNAKKATFLSEVLRRLALDRVQISRVRMDEFKGEPNLRPHSCFDFITARAFGQFEDLLRWSRAHLSKSGRLVLWLGRDGLASISKTEGWTWATPARIPGSDRRFIVSGSPSE
jgi:16S rRNA (guanine527-N7)-methyltransferase